jgi:hypothetical protein
MFIPRYGVGMAATECRCGCGELRQSSQARYVVGHDARHCSRLYWDIVNGSLTEEQALAEIGPYKLADQLIRRLARRRT